MTAAKSNADLDLAKVSRDCANTTYQPTTQDLPPDAGAHSEQILGAAAGVKAATSKKEKTNA